MIIRIGKNLIWILVIISLILAVLLAILYFLGYQQQEQNKKSELPTIGKWIVLSKEDYSGLTLVVVQDGKTLEREPYKSVKLINGYESINSEHGPNQFNLSNRFIIFDLPFSDRNELTDEVLTSYIIDNPFDEIYYCGDLTYPLTITNANQIISDDKLTTSCTEINGFLF
jgi:NADH:ubiquinone oxidoreductase subunit 3 (subunit A)